MKDGLALTSEAGVEGDRKPAAGWRSWLVRSALLIVIAGLLIYAVRNANPAGIWRVLSRLQPWQVIAIVGLDAAIFTLIGCRWWLLVRATRAGATLFSIARARLSAFGVSYFTFGPQVGGEPLQVVYLHRRYAFPFTKAAATVALDKLAELLGNYVFLIVGLGALSQSGLLRSASHATEIAIFGATVLAAWPLLHIALLRRNVLPVSAAVRIIPGLRRPENSFGRQVRTSEKLVARFCQRNPRLLAAVVCVSMLASLLAVIEYALVTSFLHVVLTPWQTISAWTAGWLSFIMPVPGGLGALEASQVLALGAFGVGADAALGVALLLRARDILMGGAGLLLTAHHWAPSKSKTD